MTRDTEDVVERLRRRTVPVMGGAGLYEVVLDERPDTLCAKAADLIQSLSDRIDVQQKALAAVRTVIENGYPGQPAKTEECQHGKFGYEDCIACYDEALLAAIEIASLTQGGK